MGFFGADSLCSENLHLGILTLDNFEFQNNFSMYVYEKFTKSLIKLLFFCYILNRRFLCP